MAFPTTSVLTTFTGPNEEPLSEGGLWNSTMRIVVAAVQPCRLVSNTVGVSSTVTVGVSESLWDTSYAENQEVFATISAIDPTIGFSVHTRVQNERTSSAQALQFGYSPDLGVVRFFRMTNNGTFTQIGSSITQTLSVGDAIGLHVQGTTLEGWVRVAGTWNKVGQETDSVISGPGKLGISLNGGPGILTRLDDFGGGATVTTSLERRSVIRSGMTSW